MRDAAAEEVDWNEVGGRFSPPPELVGPPPRRVVARDAGSDSWRSRLGRGCLSGCLAPFLVLGVLLVLWAGLAALILPLGTRGRGHVIEREQGNGRDSTYFLKFRFRASERSYEGQWQVRTERWRRTRVGDEITVRYFSFAPGVRPVLEDGLSPWAAIFGLGPLGLLMTGIGAVSLAGMRTRRTGKRLVQRGIVVFVVVVSVSAESGRVSFLLRDEEGRVIEVQTRTQSGRHRVGSVEAGLYLPGHAAGAQLYLDLDWRAVI